MRWQALGSGRSSRYGECLERLDERCVLREVGDDEKSGRVEPTQAMHCHVQSPVRRLLPKVSHKITEPANRSLTWHHLEQWQVGPAVRRGVERLVLHIPVVPLIWIVEPAACCVGGGQVDDKADRSALVHLHR